MKIQKLPIVFISFLLALACLIFGTLLGLGLAETVNTINSENYTNFSTSLPTKLLDINGELITEFSSDEKREIIYLKDLPQHLLDALISREDRVFYKHHGFSFKALSRAVYGVLTHNTLGGGSTLSQQVAGTLYCDRRDYSVARKLKELWWAVQMERRYSKNEMLEFYLNYIYFGGGTYGVSAAAKYYFGHSALEVTPAESAVLVIQLSNPSAFNPFAHPNMAMPRQKNVLDEMLGQKHQIERQIYVLPCRTTPPVASVCLYRHARIDETVLFGQFVQHFWQKQLSLSPDHIQYCLSEPFLALWSKRFVLRIEEYRLAHFDANLIVFRPYRLQMQRKTVRMYAVRCVDDGFARFTVL